MKTTKLILACLLLASIGGVSPGVALGQQTPAPAAARPLATIPAPGIRHLYLKNGKTHLIVRRTQIGTRVYRQVGRRVIPMN